MTQNILFKEKQRFRQWWLWLIVVFAVVSTISISGQQLLAGKDFSIENTLAPLLLLVLPLSLFGLVFSIRLETEIKTDGIYVRFFPIHKKFRFYPWAELEQVYVREYNPVAEYGGWGMRGLGKNRALNISGREGLQLVLKDGKRLLIGTRKREEINTALRNAGQFNNVLPQK